MITPRALSAIPEIRLMFALVHSTDAASQQEITNAKKSRDEEKGILMKYFQ